MDSLKNLSEDYKVVVIEGSRFFQKRIRTFLEKYFVNIHITDNWEDGFKMIVQSAPNILIADMNVPGVDALDLIKKVKRIDTNIEIIVFSTHYDTANLLEAFHVGITDFIPKPINYTILLKAIQKSLDHLYINKNVKIEVSDENKTIFDILEELHNEKVNLEFINYYKGVPIIRLGKIIEVNDDIIEAEADQIQLKAALYEKFTAIEANSIGKSFVAKLHSYSKTASTIKLKNFKELVYSPKRRVLVRVVTDEDFKLIVLNKGKKYTVIVNDISAKSISFIVSRDKDTFNVDDEITLNIGISPKNQTHRSKVIIKCAANIYQSYHTHHGLCVVATFELDSKLQDDLNKYIYERELEIIEEFRSLEIKPKK